MRKGKPIDATGAYETRAGETVKFDGVQDLATFLAASEETHTAFVQQLFHHLVKQPVRALRPPDAGRPEAILRRPRFQYPQADGGDHGDVGFDAAWDRSRKLKLSVTAGH